ncbi:hypothetical protein Tco_0887280 [Tanacetum coccineum]
MEVARGHKATVSSSVQHRVWSADMTRLVGVNEMTTTELNNVKNLSSIKRDVSPCRERECAAATEYRAQQHRHEVNLQPYDT